MLDRRRLNAHVERNWRSTARSSGGIGMQMQNVWELECIWKIDVMSCNNRSELTDGAMRLWSCIRRHVRYER